MRNGVKGIVTVALVIAGGAVAVFSSDRGVFRMTTRADVHPASATIRIKELVVRAEVARTPDERSRGLSGRDGLAEGTGMFFMFDRLDQHAMWMRDMKFSIDIIWIAGGVVVDTHENLPVPAPGTDPARLPFFTPRPQALFALEVPAGTVAQYGITHGARVEAAFDGNGAAR